MCCCTGTIHSMVNRIISNIVVSTTTTTHVILHGNLGRVTPHTTRHSLSPIQYNSIHTHAHTHNQSVGRSFLEEKYELLLVVTIYNMAVGLLLLVKPFLLVFIVHPRWVTRTYVPYGLGRAPPTVLSVLTPHTYLRPSTYDYEYRPVPPRVLSPYLLLWRGREERDHASYMVGCTSFWYRVGKVVSISRSLRPSPPTRFQRCGV
jgi:hypothetical protein